jgi:hypothetical protein
LAVVLALSSSLVYAQSPTCAAPGCNSVASDASYNTAAGSYALSSDTSGSNNTAVGRLALYSNTSGSYNTASGFAALIYNTTGSNNTAVGYHAANGIQIGQNNVALGYEALFSGEDTTANDGMGTFYTTAIGAFALYSNTAGYDNIALGAYAMYANTHGNSNVAVGNSALSNNLDGNGNFALGTGALVNNIHGCYNVAIGPDALYKVNGAAPSSVCAAGAQGSNNIAIGLSAGNAIVTGSNNIDIGVAGLSTDNGVTRMGGIYEVPVSGTTMPVVVNSSGQLGMAPSSERYKTDIAPMPPMSDRLSQLHPVTFHYKEDPTRTLQYGLIAEEVAKVYPELVMRDESGTILSVHYEELAPILLNEIQQQKSLLVAQAAHASAQAGRFRHRSYDDRCV